jgi:hypothetical protein
LRHGDSNVVIRRDYRGYIEEILLGEDELLLIMSGYSLPLRKRIIKRYRAVLGELSALRQQEPIFNLNDPDQMALVLQKVLGDFQAERAKNKAALALVDQQKAQLQKQEPDVHFAEVVGSASGNIELTEAAKILQKYHGIGPNQFFSVLRERDILYEDGSGKNGKSRAVKLLSLLGVALHLVTAQVMDTALVSVFR